MSLLFPWSSGGRTINFTLQFYWFQVQIPVETAIFSHIFLLGGYFCSSKWLGPAVANFELMINLLMMNRVNFGLLKYKRSKFELDFTLKSTQLFKFSVFPVFIRFDAPFDRPFTFFEVGPLKNKSLSTYNRLC